MVGKQNVSTSWQLQSIVSTKTALPNAQQSSEAPVPEEWWLWDDLNTRSSKSPTGYLFQVRGITDSTVLVDRQVDSCRLALGNAKSENVCSRMWKD